MNKNETSCENIDLGISVWKNKNKKLSLRPLDKEGILTSCQDVWLVLVESSASCDLGLSDCPKKKTLAYLKFLSLKICNNLISWPDKEVAKQG